MGESFTIEINPKTLAYAIDNSGYTLEELADSIKSRSKVKYFNIEYLTDITKGKISPKYTDLKKIDSFLKRGVPYYFLNNPPKDRVFVKFRNKYPNFKLSPGLEIKLRKYELLREDIKDLCNLENIPFERTVPIYTLNDSPVEVAHEFRNLFNFDEIDIDNLESKDVFKTIRERIEDKLVFVFKDDLEYLRGCIFIGNNLPTLILVNSTEDKNGEIFTLLHEFAHFLLDNEEIDVDISKYENDPNIERWCNSFSYHFMMKDENESKEKFLYKNKEELLDSYYLTHLSNKYKISKLAFVYRFYLLDLISSEDYNDYKKRSPYKHKRTANKSGGGNYYLTLKTRLSNKFTSLVYRNYVTGNISTYEAFNYLQVKDHSRMNQLVEV
ncbi:MAG TPA: ImmA/IrrE family metallo-endopeptidase [Methanofastidiosum sp.]|nr:ImmA/IrrE family metallo-endopeptidase [Methanofastidiosum sp.]